MVPVRRFGSPRLRFLMPDPSPDPGSGGDTSGGGGASAGVGGVTGSEPRTFTQEEVARLAAREKDQGERAGKAALLGALGFTKAEDLTKFVTEAKAAQDAAMTETQRKEAAITDREVAVAAREAAATAALAEAKRTTALAAAGASGADLADATRLLDAPQDADDTALAAAVDALKGRRPELFKGAGTAAAPTAPLGRPGGTTQPPATGAPAGQGTPGARGKAEADRRFGARVKQDA